MVRKSIEQRLSELEARKKALVARLNKQERAADTRRKILLGALVLDRLEHGSDEVSKLLHGWLRKELPGYLTRGIDKDLFDDLLREPPSAAKMTANTSEAPS